MAAATALAAACAVPVGCSAGSEEESTGARTGPSTHRVEFVDVASRVGLDVRHGAFLREPSPDPVAMMGGGLCWLDADGDGRLDLFVVNGFSQSDRGAWRAAGGLPTTRLFRNEGARFADVTEASGTGFAVRGQGCVAADLDVDGHTDLFVTTAERSLLLWNDGDGSFTEGAEAAGAAVFGWHSGAAAGDLNGDGRPELFVAGYTDLNNRVPEATRGFPSTYLGVRDVLLLNEEADDGRARFREVGREAGLEVVRFEHGLGALLSDLERDGDLDLVVANDTDPNRLYENVPWPGGVGADPAGLGFRLEERAAAAGTADTGAGMGVAGGDFDGDGRADLFVTNARRQVHAVYRSRLDRRDEPSFADVRSLLGPDLTGRTGWGVSWGDLDLDADLDVVLVNGAVPVTDLDADRERVQVLLQGGPGRFADSSGVLDGVDALLARSSAAADWDNDGDVDVAVLVLGGPLVLLENTGTGGNWLEVELHGFGPSAEVTAVLPGGRRLRREVHAGSSYLSSEDPRAHFGLGQARSVRELVVRLGEATVRLRDVEANRIVAVEAPR